MRIRTVSGKVLKDRAYEIALNPEYDGYQRGLTSMVYKFFDKKKKIRSECKRSAISGITQTID